MYCHSNVYRFVKVRNWFTEARIQHIEVWGANQIATLKILKLVAR